MSKKTSIKNKMAKKMVIVNTPPNQVTVPVPNSKKK